MIMIIYKIRFSYSNTFKTLLPVKVYENVINLQLAREILRWLNILSVVLYIYNSSSLVDDHFVYFQNFYFCWGFSYLQFFSFRIKIIFQTCCLYVFVEILLLPSDIYFFIIINVSVIWTMTIRWSIFTIIILFWMLS